MMSLNKLFFTLLFLLLYHFSPLFAQTYGNEWINYTQPYYKIKVTQDGIYRIPTSVLNAAGINTLSAPGSSLVIYYYGNYVPTYVTTTGLFGPNDYIEFYGQWNDGRLDTRLFSDPNHQVNTYHSLYNDTSVYFLTVELGNSAPRILNITNDLTNLPPKENTCTVTEVQQFNGNYSPGKPYLFGNEFLYRAIYDEGEGFIGGLITQYNTQTVQINTPGFASSGNATLKTTVVSTSNTDHRLVIKFNNNTLKDTTFNGFKLHKHSFNISQSQLAASNNIDFSSLGTGNADNNAIALVELIYQKNFDFDGKSRFTFSVSGTSGPKYLEITNFNDQSTNPVLYDFTNNARIEGTQGANPYRFKLPSAPATAERKIYLTGQGAGNVFTISNIEKITFLNFNDPANHGNFIIVSHPSLFNDGTGFDWVGEYAKYRQTVAGGSWTAKVVKIDELYDQFAYGVRKHPLSIRNFMNYAHTNWTLKPKHLFLIGKGRVYDVIRYNATNYNQCLVPTFGNKGPNFGGSDNLLTASTTSIVPLISTGRLSALTGNDVKIYLQKIKDFEEQQNKTGDPYQTIANKLWMKEILHMGGGLTINEQQRFRGYLQNFAQEALCDYYGGNVTGFYKTSSDPIQIGASNDIKARIDNGVSLITFFGHSSAGSFDISIDDPQNFTNFKKYPLIFSNGCFTGNVFTGGYGISEQFVLAPNKGAIGFLSTTSLSSDLGLNLYSGYFYKNFAELLYDMSVGEAMQKTTADVEQSTAFPPSLMIAEEMLLNCDPSIKLNTHKKPDWCLEPQMISFVPSTVSVEDATFTIRAVIPNLGKSMADSTIVLSVDRTFPDGSTVNYSKTIPAPCYVDTVDIEIPTGAALAFGLNEFCLKIENENKIDELSETNNRICLSLNILSDDIFPIYPYEFAIVNQKNITLAASTANTFAPQRTYLIEIDTTELFNSPLKQSQTFTMVGGLLKWTPNVNYIDSVVYYWRVGSQGTGRFNYSSFVYLDNDSPGWNQSHYFQFKKDQFENILHDDTTDRLFEFVGDLKEVSVYTGVWPGSIGDPQTISYSLNGGVLQKWNCGGSGGFPSGLTVAVFDPVTGKPWLSLYPSEVATDPCSGYQINAIHKSIHCKARNTESYMFPVGINSPCNWEQRLMDFLNNIPNGYYVLIYSVNCVQYNNFPPALVNLLASLGSVEISNLSSSTGCVPWAFFGRKGDPNFSTEKISNINTVLEFKATFSASWYEGSVTSPLIGPAFKWKEVFWSPYSLETPSNDIYSLDIIGVKKDKSETVVASGITAPQFNLNFIDPNVYPWIRLRMNTKDDNDTTRTPTQLDDNKYHNYWKVVHDIVPEAALAPNLYLEFTDNVNLGENITLKVAIENVSPVDMDSLLVKYIVNSPGNAANISYARFDSLHAGQRYNIDFRFNTNCNCLADINSLIVDANPDDDQPEQFHFNNIGILSFKMQGDNENPLLDVTFDGVHILNGDIVSAEPEILIKLKDENKYLALDDTALINVFLKYPDGTVHPQHYNSGYMTFIPATPSQLSKKNVAEIHLRKKFDVDGKYELLVQAKDKSRNISGTYGDAAVGIDYRISFEIINKEMITNTLNYPNPFSTATKFIFTLTGSQVPTYMKIQIMTITGKVVREVEMSELGPIRIGRNITEFTWNGTDQYGDRLANGLYFYRVVASLNGKPLEKLESKADKYFKSGLGKMYLMK
jgi:hypothetical protein